MRKNKKTVVEQIVSLESTVAYYTHKIEQFQTKKKETLQQLKKLRKSIE